MINGEAFSIPVSVSFVGYCIQHVLFNEDMSFCHNSALVNDRLRQVALKNTWT